MGRINPSVPRALDDLVQQMLDKEPDRRPSALEVERQLAAMQGISGPTFDEPSSDRFDPRDAQVPATLLRAVREALSPTPMRIDEIVRAVDAPHRLVLAALAELELAGEAVTHVGGTASRAV